MNLSNKEKLKIAVRALKDITNPLEKFRREVPPGHILDGQGAVMLMGSVQTYKDIAREALDKLGEGAD